MRRFIIFLLIFIASVYIGLKIAEDPGLAFFSYKHWTVEMPVWFFILSSLIIIYFVYLMIRLFDKVDFSLYRWNNWLRWRRKNKAHSKTNRGLLELIEGNWKNAEYYLMEGVSQSDSPLINFLAAAKAADEQGLYDKRDAYLRKAHDIAPYADITIGLTQAQLQLNQDQLEQALATLDHLRSVAPKHKSVLKLLERVYVRLGDWPALLSLLPTLRKARVLTHEQANLFEKNIYKEFFSSKDKKLTIHDIRNEWKRIPRKMQNDVTLISSYATRLLPYKESANELESIIYNELKKNWDKGLVKLYGEINADPQKQLIRAEGWLRQYPDDPILLLTLGKLCVRAQLWGKARTYFENSLKMAANPETYLEYGNLLEFLGDREGALASYKAGVTVTA